MLCFDERHNRWSQCQILLPRDEVYKWQSRTPHSWMLPVRQVIDMLVTLLILDGWLPGLIATWASNAFPVVQSNRFLDIRLRVEQRQQTLILRHNRKVYRLTMLAAQLAHSRKTPQDVTKPVTKCC